MAALPSGTCSLLPFPVCADSSGLRLPFGPSRSPAQNSTFPTPIKLPSLRSQPPPVTWKTLMMRLAGVWRGRGRSPCEVPCPGPAACLAAAVTSWRLGLRRQRGEETAVLRRLLRANGADGDAVPGRRSVERMPSLWLGRRDDWVTFFGVYLFSYPLLPLATGRTSGPFPSEEWR